MLTQIPKFTNALPPYLGGKRLLCALIFALLAEVVPRARWAQLQLLDPFCGGGAVALHAKGFCQNSVNDVQSGAIWGSETAFAESDGGPLDD